MLSNLTSNQARWDLIHQQESRSTMAESVVSTSSSSGGGPGSFQCESRRDSLEPPHPNHRLSRSSAEGDEDSDPCSSYPYMPLDGPEGGPQHLPVSPRRHSLPPFLSDPLFRLYTSMTSAPPSPEVMLHRQLSLVERRRSSAVQELRRQNSELLANLKLAQRRRLFAANRNRASTASTASTEAEPNPQSAKVTFHLGASGEEEVEQNTSLLHVNSSNVNNTKRRGSAPCSLLLSQINRIANSASKAASTASREHSPRGCNTRGHLGHRRGSLPCDLVELGRSHSRSSSGGPSRPAHAHSDKSSTKKRKLLRRRSAGSGDSFSNNSDVINVKRRGPSLGKRGSLKSSSFGGVGCGLGGGMTKPFIKASSKKASKGTTSESCLYTGRLSWHGNNNNHRELSEVTEAVSKLALLRNLYAPSVESELLEEIQRNDHNECNGRRGSLPIELILC